MSVGVNGSIDDAMYARLKKEVPVRAKLHPDAKMLDSAYQAASKERWGESLDRSWKDFDAEGWPK
jgi:hypothetical protein